MTDIDVAKLFPDGKFAWLSLMVASGFPDGVDRGDIDPMDGARAVLIGIPLALAIWAMSFLVFGVI